MEYILKKNFRPPSTLIVSFLILDGKHTKSAMQYILIVITITVLLLLIIIIIIDSIKNYCTFSGIGIHQRDYVYLIRFCFNLISWLDESLYIHGYIVMHRRLLLDYYFWIW